MRPNLTRRVDLRTGCHGAGTVGDPQDESDRPVAGAGGRDHGVYPPE